jgi:tetratricopeptide (TPR) repeat protein
MEKLYMQDDNASIKRVNILVSFDSKYRPPFVAHPTCPRRILPDGINPRLGIAKGYNLPCREVPAGETISYQGHNMTDSLKKLRIFAASPSDVTNERAKLETVVDSLKPMADYLGLTLEVIDWRAVVPDAGRPQQIILDQLKATSWDIFVGILWHRFGTPPGAKDKTGKDYLSGTEEEFKTAYALWKQHSKPRMVLYRCIRALPFDVDPDQLKRVREFFKLLEGTKSDYPTLYQAFDTTESFEKLLLDNLQKLLIEYSEQVKTPITPEVAQALVPKTPNNLPRRQAFFGRTKEMDIVMRALSPSDRTWGILVDGIGGIGKSALAVEAAYRVQDTGAFDAFIFITAKQNILAPFGIREQTPVARVLDDFLNETARVLGQPGIAKLANDEKRRALLDVLRTMRTLLIYDNLETLSKEEQEAMADFLRELPQGCKAIITSRRRGGEGAVWLRVEELDWDAARGIIENEMARDSGLANKLHRVEPRWQELYDKTNGSPLALVHTLGLMRVRAALTFDGALAMLQDKGKSEGDLLGQGKETTPLQLFVFQEARKELTTSDKVALGALSFFTPSATFESWMQVANLSRNALETTIDRLNALSLVDILAGQERYALHLHTRNFVRDELLADVNIERETSIRFARYWVEYAERFGGWGKENYKTYKYLEEEWANLNTASQLLWEFSGVANDSIKNDDAARMLVVLASALSSFLPFSGRWDEHIHLSERAYYAANTSDTWRNTGWRAFDVAWMHYKRAHTKEAAIWLKRCEKAWEHGGTQGDNATALRLGGLIAQQHKKFDEAERLLKASLNIRLTLNADREVAFVLISLAQLAQEQKDYQTAEKYFLEALDLGQKITDIAIQASVGSYLGELNIEKCQLSEARKWFKYAMPMAKEIGRVEVLARIQYGLALVHEAEGHADLALPLAQEALKIYEKMQRGNLAEIQKLVEKLIKAEDKNN